MTLITLPTPTDFDLKHLATCGTRVRKRRLIELAIVRKLVQACIADRRQISVGDGDWMPVERSTDETEIMNAVFAVDECDLYIHAAGAKKPSGWITLVFGNGGWDAISDYSTNLGDLLQPVNEYADQLSAWC